MPIIIDRKSGTAQSSQKLTQQQNQKAWELIVRNYIKNHPEALSDEKLKGEAS